MNKHFMTIIGLIAFFSVILLPGCKTAEVVTYTLTVDVGTGASGNPFSGIYQKEENDVVSYSYTVDAGFQNLTVTLDGTTIPSTGTFTVSGNHTLMVRAEEIFDIRGKWNLILNWDSAPADSWTITFSGGLNSGIYLDEFAHSGTYTVDGSSVVINYPVYPMKLVGSFSSQTEMMGDITESVGTGTWSATKI